MTPKRKLAALLTTLGTAFVLLLGLAPAAQANTPGLQYVCNHTTSWSGIWTSFGSGSYTVPVGQCWGEGHPNPMISNPEPRSFYVGPGWCVTWWHNSRPASPNYTWGGGTGYTQVLTINPSGGDESFGMEAWYGSWCYTSGAGGNQINQRG